MIVQASSAVSSSKGSLLISHVSSADHQVLFCLIMITQEPSATSSSSGGGSIKKLPPVNHSNHEKLPPVHQSSQQNYLKLLQVNASVWLLWSALHLKTTTPSLSPLCPAVISHLETVLNPPRVSTLHHALESQAILNKGKAGRTDMDKVHIQIGPRTLNITSMCSLLWQGDYSNELLNIDTRLVQIEVQLGQMRKT